MKLTRGQERLRITLIYGAQLPMLIAVLPLELAVLYNWSPIYLRLAIYLVIGAAFYEFVVIGVLLYWLRERRRWAYGLLEIAVALVLLLLSIFHQAPRPAADPATEVYSIPFLQSVLQTMAAWYVLVRGLDNLGQGLKTKFPAWNRRWEWFSLKPLQPEPEDIQD